MKLLIAPNRKQIKIYHVSREKCVVFEYRNSRENTDTTVVNAFFVCKEYGISMLSARL